ncbi:cytochrome c oxidase accessory protein CcoG [Shewanella japonica]|uniref:Cytochrome c oxidase accessory protein CcoG n=1 Tax=Shewanella japonica TaxID=93973 RepID=A0ABM6JF47_9GAMM|nr:cytochrome c oxidase accessory protein CcoG [Shewanella japonica]ARD20435.1 cytochrome c oxidase accessory protein CcoG [Shewanella japonica]
MSEPIASQQTPSLSQVPSQVPSQATSAVQQQRIPVINISDSGKIHVREQQGIFQRLRLHTNTVLIALFFLIPFINFQGRQAILFDVTEQQFFFFNVTLWPQDFTVLAWFFMAAAFALFFITVYFGRVWCGFMCPQTAWTAAFMWVEAKVEGNHHHRAALDKAPMSVNKVTKRVAKHTVWALMALVTGCGFMAYFMPARALYVDIFSFSSGFWTGVWVWFFALCTYLNAGWMREMMCLHCCPYSRFQAVMFDANTKTVSYDAARGENRGPRKRNKKSIKNQATTESSNGLGDCVDCHLCVDVCPTGIDIRNGLQYECINCGACVDACNQTMSKFGYLPNLISFTSENALKTGRTPSMWSLKALGYAGALVVMLVMIVLDLQSRADIQLNVIRDRQSLYRVVSTEPTNPVIENSYLLKIRNKTQQAAFYQISVSSDKLSAHDFKITNNTLVLIKAAEQLEYPITVTSSIKHPDKQGISQTREALTFFITEVNSGGEIVQGKPLNQVAQSSRFFRP